MLLYNLRFGWWNAALSSTAPNARTNASDETYPIVCEHIKSLLIGHSCDFLAICEVSNADVLHLRSNLNIDNISIIDLTETVGGTRFDFAVIYNNTKILVQKHDKISKKSTGQTVKAAEVVEVINIDDSRIIYVYLCHWTSRLYGGESKRMTSASMVYDSALRHIENDQDVIILGDFNDNPYDQSLNVNLHASRCHDAVKKYPKEYLYNPFWRFVVSESKYSHLDSKKDYRSGSYKYKEFQGTMWHSYDQAIVSGSFLTGGYWYLNEHETKIVSSAEILNDYNDSKCFIDHLPIICEITRP